MGSWHHVKLNCPRWRCNKVESSNIEYLYLYTDLYIRACGNWQQHMQRRFDFDKRILPMAISNAPFSTIPKGRRDNDNIQGQRRKLGSYNCKLAACAKRIFLLRLTWTNSSKCHRYCANKDGFKLSRSERSHRRAQDWQWCALKGHVFQIFLFIELVRNHHRYRPKYKNWGDSAAMNNPYLHYALCMNYWLK